jgi:hypothetical protein
MPPDGMRTRSQLLAAGHTDAELKALRRAGAVALVRRGAYVDPHDERLVDPAARHRLLVHPTVPRTAAGSVVSHASAAVLHGLPVEVPEHVHLTRHGSGGGRIAHRVHLHVTALGADEVVVRDGIALTSPARTLVDLARSLPFSDAVVAADSALADALLGRGELDLAVAGTDGRRGGPAVRRVAAFADGRAESVAESLSRVALLRCGLPAPVPQWPVPMSGGGVLARVDFGWPELRTVGEVDGRVKYGRLLRPGRSAGDAVYAEKLREDAIRAQGFAVVRWTWADLADFERVARRLRATFRQA